MHTTPMIAACYSHVWHFPELVDQAHYRKEESVPDLD